MNWPIKERDKINYKIPTLTLDTNHVALRSPSMLGTLYNGLYQLEYNYFYKQNIELCVTPETDFEITQGIPLENLGVEAYNRFSKTRLFKARPAGTTLDLVNDEPNVLWYDTRKILWPNISDSLLNRNQIADVNQLFFHTALSGSLSNSAFITTDTNFHTHAKDIYNQLGVKVKYSYEAWDWLRNDYGLYVPSEKEIESLYREQITDSIRRASEIFK
ncbi:MAG: hypothetical protein A2044_08765 [Candidatus Firestonebacteria bacterium GWA2_43_8]|nr:MAG: hypothetical protein A2044_08765 [Candidatus Firestonebacteria bacterium GWA2_43_8]